MSREFPSDPPCVHVLAKLLSRHLGRKPPATGEEDFPSCASKKKFPISARLVSIS
jgi:hypothetical protein